MTQRAQTRACALRRSKQDGGWEESHEKEEKD